MLSHKSYTRLWSSIIKSFSVVLHTHTHTHLKNHGRIFLANTIVTTAVLLQIRANTIVCCSNVISWFFAIRFSYSIPVSIRLTQVENFRATRCKVRFLRARDKTIREIRGEEILRQCRDEVKRIRVDSYRSLGRQKKKTFDPSVNSRRGTRCKATDTVLLLLNYINCWDFNWF